MASEEITVIILAAQTFSPLVQNKLLKVIEEPPKNKEFILITESKSTVLNTIKSSKLFAAEGSSADVGSSNNSTRGSLASARANEIRCCCPRDKLSTSRAGSILSNPTIFNNCFTSSVETFFSRKLGP